MGGVCVILLLYAAHLCGEIGADVDGFIGQP